MPGAATTIPRVRRAWLRGVTPTQSHALARNFAQTFVAYAGRRRLSRAGGLIAASTLCEGIGILLLVPLAGIIWRDGAGTAGVAATAARSFLGRFGPTGELIVGFAIFAGLIVLRGLVLTARDTELARLQHGFVEATKLRLFERLAAAPWSRVARLDRAQLVQTLGSEMVQVAAATSQALQACVAGVLLAGYFVVALVLAPQLFLLTFAFIGAMAVASSGLLDRAVGFGRVLLTHDVSMSQTSLRFLASLKLAAAQDLQRGFLERYAADSEVLLARRVEFDRMISSARNLATALAALTGGGAMLLGIFLFDLPPPVLIAFIVLLSRMIGPAMTAQRGTQQVAHALPRFALLQTLENELSLSPQPARARSVFPVEDRAGAPAIDLRDVSFAHTTGDGVLLVLDRLNLEIDAGEMVGVGGPSGSGKTTFLDLVAGLNAPLSGALVVAGHELGGGSLAGHRQRLAYVGQDPVLFGDTVRQNLLWHAPDSHDAAIWAALDAVGASGLVRSLGSGLDSRLAEEGASLSAGEQQRLAIARALLRKPSLMLLDEATCSLDAASEQRILDGLRSLARRPTVILVSHRRESLERCDRVLTFAGGRIVHDKRPGGRAEAMAQSPTGGGPRHGILTADGD